MVNVLLHLQPNAALFSPNDLFGKTFTDWLPFHANNLGIVLTDNAQYANTDELLAAVTGYLDKQKEEGVAPITENSIASANFCVVESVQQMLSVARLRRQWMLKQTGLLSWEPVTDWENPAYDQYAEMIEGYLRSWSMVNGQWSMAGPPGNTKSSWGKSLNRTLRKTSSSMSASLSLPLMEKPVRK